MYYGDVYVYEVDGIGCKLFMDDVNVLSLFVVLYFGFCEKIDFVY